jgi:2Fe-2S ferredoxin
VRVRFVNVGLEAEARIGESLLEVARRAGAPEASRCKGVCACSTCHVYVEAGADLLSLSALEPRDASRLGCQARFVAEGPCDVAISEESFQAYLDLYPQDRERALALWLKNGG